MDLIIKGFQDLTNKDVYEIMRARNEVFVVEQDCVYQDCDGKDIEAYHLFLMEKERIVAYLRILPKKVSYDEISIGRVLVLKEYRNKGLARKILLEGINFIENELFSKDIRISAQAYLEKFYISLGFSKCSEIYLEDNIPHIEMIYDNN